MRSTASSTRRSLDASAVMNPNGSPARRTGAGLDELRQDRLQALGRRRQHAQARERGLVVAEAGLEGFDLEVAAALGDTVEEGVHQTGVEEIALDLDCALAHLGRHSRDARG